jgi:hypothetical protein
MSASKSRPKSSSATRRKQKGWQFFLETHGPDTDLEVRTAMVKPIQARQFIIDTIRDMETILGRGRIYGAVPEPQWLTDAVEASLARRRSRHIE